MRFDEETYHKLKKCRLLILCGGKSSRMGVDKILLKSRKNKPIIEEFYQKFSEYFNQVFFAINKHQESVFDAQFPHLIDLYEEKGLISGIVTSMKDDNRIDLCILGGDYFEANINHFLKLMSHKEEGDEAICFCIQEEDSLQPLLIYLEKSGFDRLVDFFENGNTSFRHFLEHEVKLKKIEIDKSEFPLNINTKEDYKNYLGKWSENDI